MAIARRPISRLRKGVTGILAATAILGAGCKAPKTGSYDKVTARRSTVEQTVGKRGLEEKRVEEKRESKGETLNDHFYGVALDVVTYPNPKSYATINRYAPLFKKSVYNHVREIVAKMKITSAESRAETINMAKEKYTKYPELLIAVLEGIALNPNFTK